MKIEVKFWRSNPQFPKGGYETTKVFETKSWTTDVVYGGYTILEHRRVE